MLDSRPTERLTRSLRKRLDTAERIWYNTRIRNNKNEKGFWSLAESKLNASRK